MAVAYASHGVAPRLGPRDPPHVGTVLLHRPGRTSLEREHQREGDGEQQYEEAEWPQGKCELPSMGATVAECGRSLSAWSALQHRPNRPACPEWVSRRSFRQVGAGSPKSLYFACAALTCASNCCSVGQPLAARSS